MATRSRIGIQDESGVVRSIYCHWDGYPSGVGAILEEHYSNRQKLNMLINLGDISILEENVATVHEHSFNNPKKGVTVAYHRDRGEKLRPARVDSSLEMFANSDYETYGYVYTLEDRWVTFK
jgi:hypothetical protein